MNSHESLFLLAAAWTGYDRVGTLPDRHPSHDSATPPANENASRPDPAVAAKSIVNFWRDAGPSLWFAKDAAFDQRFRERFANWYEAAARGELAHWTASPESALALILLLDQYPRNSFRGTPRMYATDPLARGMAATAIGAAHDQRLEAPLRLFMYLPYGHSESLADQERSVELSRSLGQPSLSHAERHRDIIRRFGRFPHRNQILGRASRPEEIRYLAEGGFGG